MTIEQIYKEVNQVFNEAFDVEVELNPITTADEIEEWDSIGHIQLIVALEKHFKIKFTSVEIVGFKNVGDMCNLISSKTNKTN